MNYYPHGKRLFDLVLIAGQLVSLLLLSVLLLLLFLCTLLFNSKGPLLFSQIRAGLKGKPFRIYKFRTLELNDVDKLAMGHVTHNHPMATPVGRIMRRFKIDEMPQLWNILKGEMSVVGPRPVYLEMVTHYTPEQRRRLDVPPGLTGWSQVNGNCELTWDERICLDLWYVDHLSFWLDVKILWMTAKVILYGEVPNPKALDEANAYLASRRLSTEPQITTEADERTQIYQKGSEMDFAGTDR
jgi:sugar transferase EpsL